MSLEQRFTTPNVVRADRVLRALPAVVFLYALATGAVSRGAPIALGIVSAMLLLKAITGLCYIYAVLGLSIRKVTGA